MRRIRIGLLVTLIAGASACEYAFSDVATRIRYRLLAESASLRDSSNETAVVAMQPDHWPDQCRRGQGYRLVVSPYKGGKQVATGDLRRSRNVDRQEKGRGAAYHFAQDEQGY